jgi:hypothetical protein
MVDKEIWVFSDLDDSLITSQRLRPEKGARIVASDSKGPVAYLTKRQRDFLRLLIERTMLVPTTARSLEPYLEMKLPRTKYAVTTMGGLVLVNGKPDERWLELVGPQARLTSEALRELLAHVEETVAREGIDARARVTVDAGMDMFLSIKHNARNREELNRLKEVVCARLPEGFHTHDNGNFVAAMPPWLGKDRAVAWLLANVVPAGALTIGLGDSNSDLPFMKLCHFACLPTQSQAFSTLIAALAGAGASLEVSHGQVSR